MRYNEKNNESYETFWYQDHVLLINSINMHFSLNTFYYLLPGFLFCTSNNNFLHHRLKQGARCVNGSFIVPMNNLYGHIGRPICYSYHVPCDESLVDIRNNLVLYTWMVFTWEQNLKAFVLVDLNEFSFNLLKVQHSHFRHQKTISNLLRIHLKGKLRFGTGSPLEGAMYKNLWWIWGGGWHPENYKTLLQLVLLMWKLFLINLTQ